MIDEITQTSVHIRSQSEGHMSKDIRRRKSISNKFEDTSNADLQFDSMPISAEQSQPISIAHSVKLSEHN
jgi:hypothetical protein